MCYEVKVQIGYKNIKTTCTIQASFGANFNSNVSLQKTMLPKK
jgi:hypothetical protein